MGNKLQKLNREMTRVVESHISNLILGTSPDSVTFCQLTELSNSVEFEEMNVTRHCCLSGVYLLERKALAYQDMLVTYSFCPKCLKCIYFVSGTA